MNSSRTSISIQHMGFAISENCGDARVLITDDTAPELDDKESNSVSLSYFKKGSLRGYESGIIFLF